MQTIYSQLCSLSVLTFSLSVRGFNMPPLKIINQLFVPRNAGEERNLHNPTGMRSPSTEMITANAVPTLS